MILRDKLRVECWNESGRALVVVIAEGNVVRFSIDSYAPVVVDPTCRRLDAGERLSSLNVERPSQRDGKADLYRVPPRWNCAPRAWRDEIDVVVGASPRSDHDRDNGYDDDRGCPRCQSARLRLHTIMMCDLRR